MRIHVVVRGQVQGVGFRWFAREAARRWDLAGWVTNQADGSVKIAAEGNSDALDAFRKMLEVGPRGARVESVDDAGILNDPLERPFTIVR